MIVLYKGRRGCGKTLTMIKDGLMFKNNKWDVYRNMSCKYGVFMTNDEILKLDKNSKIKNAVIMIDEIQIFFDSRQSMSKKNVIFSNFLQQIRKRNIVLLCTTQYSNTVDLRLRQHIDVLARPNFNKKYNVCEVDYIDVTSLEDSFFELTQPKRTTVIYDAEPVFNMFSSGEMIK